MLFFSADNVYLFVSYTMLANAMLQASQDGMIRGRTSGVRVGLHGIRTLRGVRIDLVR